MSKGLLVAILVSVLFLGVVASPVAPVKALEKPKICELAGYGPQYFMECIIQICLELWIDPLDYLE